jgi:hypothetical protein
MLKGLQEPLKAAIEGHAITLSESDAAIMLKFSALEVIKEKALVREWPKEDATTSQNQRCTGCNATVNAVAGVRGNIALHQRAQGENRLIKEAEKKLTGLKREKQSIEKILELVLKKGIL